MKEPYYIIRTTKTFTNINDAREAKLELDQAYPLFPLLEVGYHIDQPTYKSWVPKWIINLITK
jgi:hypothetical protein